MSINIGHSSFATVRNSFATVRDSRSYDSYYMGERDSQPTESTYLSLVKRAGLDWKIEMHESRDKQKHLNYIESLRGNPNVEEAKVLQFNKIAEVVNTKSPTTTKIEGPIIDEIKLR